MCVFFKQKHVHWSQSCTNGCTSGCTAYCSPQEMRTPKLRSPSATDLKKTVVNWTAQFWSPHF